ncbi:MAG TPA: hypothetical protein VHV74_24290 [Pseudonocardiaceae bacterium]|nr:hypothetical protein [Pseudonocardiaceae bacterium]
MLKRKWTKNEKLKIVVEQIQRIMGETRSGLQISVKAKVSGHERNEDQRHENDPADDVYAPAKGALSVHQWCRHLPDDSRAQPGTEYSGARHPAAALLTLMLRVSSCSRNDPEMIQPGVSTHPIGNWRT